MFTTILFPVLEFYPPEDGEWTDWETWLCAAGIVASGVLLSVGQVGPVYVPFCHWEREAESLCHSVTGGERERGWVCDILSLGEAGWVSVPFCHWERRAVCACAILSQAQTALSLCQHYYVVWMKVEKLVKGRNSVQCAVRSARGLWTVRVRHVTLQEAPLWNANGSVHENFHTWPVCWCGNIWAWGRGEFRPRQTRQLPRAVDLKGRLLSCQSY